MLYGSIENKWPTMLRVAKVTLAVAHSFEAEAVKDRSSYRTMLRRVVGSF